MGRLATLPAISHTATSTAQIGDFHIAPSLPRQEVVGDFLWMRQHRVMASVDLCVGAVQSFGGPPLMHFWGQRTPRAAQHVDLPRARPEVAQVNWIVGRADRLLRISRGCPVAYFTGDVGKDRRPRLFRRRTIHAIASIMRLP